MRLFVALDLSNELRARVAELLAELKPTAVSARWVRPAGLHLTLKFIGEVPDAQLGSIRACLRPLASRDPITLGLSGLGYFPHERSPRVLWVGVEAPGLGELARDIETALASLGIRREDRPYVPHLTLARFTHPGQLSPLREAVRQRYSMVLGQMEVQEFQLYQSQLSPQGARYTVLERFLFLPAGREGSAAASG
jgi:2'-5' RNA ligase